MLAQRITAFVYGVMLVLILSQGAPFDAHYSTSTIYREQMESLLGGRLALSTNVAAVRHDLTWSEGGVHQVWGLGVPLWRSLWHLLARAAGFAAFPDLWALGLFGALAAYLILRAFWNWQEDQAGAPAYFWANAARMSGTTLMLLLFPPFFGLLATRFDIYEEAVVYEYLYGLMLLGTLARLAQQPDNLKWLALCTLAGLGGFIRPPLVFYGIAALAVGALVWWKASSSSFLEVESRSTSTPPSSRLFKLALGLALFALGSLLLFYTNLARFGSGFEFGHRLNLQHLYGSMYATRFDHPYQQEPLASAVRELLGLLFFTRELNGGDFYREHFFPGQSATVRWREMYLTTYNPWYWPWLAGGVVAMACAVVAWWRRWRQGAEIPAHERVIAALGLWGLLAGIMLFGFYLRNSVISSRYLLDFMPAFAALMVAGWLGWCAWIPARRGGKMLLFLSFLLLNAWAIGQIQSLRRAYGAPHLLTWPETERRLEREKNKTAQPLPPLPALYDSPAMVADSQIPYNGAGWTPETGAVKPLIILFVDNPQYLELTLRHEREDWESEPPRHVRAKIGLEFLERESVTKGAEGWVVRFRGPRQHRYQQGLQVAFIVFVPPTQLANYQTPWRLVKAQWRNSEKAP